MTEPTHAQAVADFLAQHPEFFEDNPELTASLKLSSPLGGRTVSLQDRQVEVLREKIRQLELRLANLTRVAKDNDAIIANFHEWTLRLWRSQDADDLGEAVTHTLCEAFDLPAASLRLWDHATDAGNAREFADGLASPYCGPAIGQPGLAWLPDPASMQSTALIPLRKPGTTESIGLLVLASPDAQRFSSDMATDVLSRIGETASAVLEGLVH
jgi:uncharacterized protein YigA (DUF484 family)